MRRLLYTAAVLALLIPLGAAVTATTASAATTCSSGGAPLITVQVRNSGTTDLVGYWHISDTDTVNVSYSLTPADFCEVNVSGATAFREQGTSDCVAFQPSTNVVLMRSCDYSSANQVFVFHPTGGLAAESENGCLDTAGGDGGLYNNSCGAAPDNQEMGLIPA
jgi:hypothetical protein